MTITPHETTEKLLQREPSLGRFQSAEDLMAHALSLVETETASLTARRRELLQSLDKAVAEADRGEGLTEDQMRAGMVTRRAGASR